MMDGIISSRGWLALAALVGWAAFGEALVPCTVYSRAQPVDLPELLVTTAGKRVSTAAEWERERRPEIMDFLTRNVYGVRPAERPSDLSFEPVEEDRDMLQGRARRKRTRISFSGPRGGHSFEACVFVPNRADAEGRAPAFILLCNRALEQYADIDLKVKSEFFPVEEIIARGYAVAVFRNTEIASDDHVPRYLADGSVEVRDPDFTNEIHACWSESRTEDGWGTISAWAWGFSRVIDWLETLPEIDSRRIAVIGHSRGGKTALWAGATDDRIALVCANDSGCCGAKLNHVAVPFSETIQLDDDNNPHWFCRRFRQFNGRDAFVPYDQHWLAALIAPRLLCIGSASEDVDAGPWGEFLTARHASPAWELYGGSGLVEDGRYRVGAALQSGHIGYHLREGAHDLNLEDWRRYLDFADRHLRGETLGGDATAERLDLQAQIDRVHAAGGGVVGVPGGEWIVGPFVLKSKVTLQLDACAVLRADDEAVEGVNRSLGRRRMISADGAEGVTIRGRGVIRGGMMSFRGCRDLRFEDFTCRDCGACACELRDCEGVVFERVRLLCDDDGTSRPIAADRCTGVEVRQGLRGAAPYRLVAQDGVVDEHQLVPDFTVTPRGIFGLADRFDAIERGQSVGLSWCVFRERLTGRCILVYDAKLPPSALVGESFLRLRHDAAVHRAAIVGCRARGCEEWLNAQRNSPEWDVRDTDLSIWYDPLTVAPYEFRLDAPASSPLHTQGAAHIFDFSFRLEGASVDRSWEEYVPSRVAAGDFGGICDDRIVLEPSVGDTPIRTVVETGQTLLWLRRKFPGKQIVLKPLSSESSQSSAVNDELRKFAVERNVVLEGFAGETPPDDSLSPASRPMSRIDAVSSSRAPWWWFHRLSQKNRQIVRSGGNFDLVMIGDSITHFMEGSSYWSCGRPVMDGLSREFKLLNLGYGGDSTQHVLWRLQNGELDGYRAKWISLMIGTNNASRPEDTAQAIGRILELIAEKQPQAGIVLMALLPRSDPGSADRKRVNRINELIRPLADGRRIAWLDLTERFLQPDGTVCPGLMADEWNVRTKSQYNLHPHELGYEILSRGLRSAMSLNP